MTFQFLCPQGHLLQGDEAHMGMQCQCPQCGTAFIIPTVEQPAHSDVDDLIGPLRQQLASEADTPFESAAGPANAEQLDAGPFHAEPPGEGPQSDPASSPFDPESFVAGELGRAAVAETLLHIPCPNGHELETPLDMIGQRVMCPHCRAEFRLRREQSIEYIRQQEIIDRRRAKFWFQLSVVVGSFVVVLLLAMMVVMMSSN